MATAHTKSDALAYYYSDPAGLGGARSALPFLSLDFIVGNAIPPIIVERVSPSCGEGTAYIRATTGDMVEFKAPGDDYGTAVNLPANTRVLFESDTPAKSVTLYRDSVYSAADIEGEMTLELVKGVNNAIGMNNITTAGATNYGGFWILNQSTIPVYGITVTGTSPYTVAIEAPSGGVVQEIANNTTAPSAVSFGSSDTLAVLQPGDAVFVWLKRVVGATSVSILTAGTVTVAYEYAGTTYTDAMSGYYRVGNAALALYELHVGEDALPDFTSATATSATLPFTQALTEEVASYYAVRKRNLYNLQSLNTLCDKTVVGVGGSDDTEVLTDPEVVSAVSGPGGEVVLRLRYNGSADATEADTWRLYITTDGTTPDPGTDTPEDTAMVNQGLGRIDREQIIYLGPYTYGDTIKIIARVYSSTLDDESESVAVTSVTIDTQNPVGIHQIGITMGATRGIQPSVAEGITYYNSPTNTVGVRILTGETVLFGTSDAFRAEVGLRSLFRTALNFANVTHSDSGAATPIEVIDANTFYINVNGTRRAKIDLTVPRIEAATFIMLGQAIDLPVIGPIHTTSTATYIQMRNSITGRWTPAIKVDSSGVMTITAEVLQEVA